MKKRANSRKGLKIEHVSEATAGQTKRHLSDLSGRGEWTPEPRLETCALRPIRATKPALCFLVPPGAHPHSKEAQLNSDWPSLQGWAGEMKHFGVSELSKHLDCSTRPESRKRRGAGVVIPHHGGTGFPLKNGSCSIWGIQGP